MVQINLCSDGYVWELKSIGHTDSQVCSGISAILWAFAGAIQNLPGIYYREEDMILKDGNFFIQIQVTEIEELNNKIDCFYQMMKIGILQIQKTYPKSVDVNVE